MSTTTRNFPSLDSDRGPTFSPHFGSVGRRTRTAVVAGAIAALSLTAIAPTARAGNPGVGAAIGLGILGGVVAGAAIAATAPPIYAAPAPYYYGPSGYYGTPPAYYPQPQPYSPTAYPPANYGYAYGH